MQVPFYLPANSKTNDIFLNLEARVQVQLKFQLLWVQGFKPIREYFHTAIDTRWPRAGARNVKNPWKWVKVHETIQTHWEALSKQYNSKVCAETRLKNIIREWYDVDELNNTVTCKLTTTNNHMVWSDHTRK